VCAGALTPQLNQGQSCLSSGECESGLFCQKQGDVCPGTCTAYLAAGQPCAPDGCVQDAGSGQCANDLICNSKDECQPFGLSARLRDGLRLRPEHPLPGRHGLPEPEPLASRARRPERAWLPAAWERPATSSGLRTPGTRSRLSAVGASVASRGGAPVRSRPGALVSLAATSRSFALHERLVGARSLSPTDRAPVAYGRT
jgi:hypothetical protein